MRGYCVGGGGEDDLYLVSFAPIQISRALTLHSLTHPATISLPWVGG